MLPVLSPLSSLLRGRSLVFAFQPVEIPHQTVIIAGISLGALLTSTAFLTIGWSLKQYRQRQKTEAVREEVRSGLLERMYGTDDPDWDTWIKGLSESQRAVLEALLDEYLRELDGNDAQRLAKLGDTLGITDRARHQLKTGSYYERLHALTWLALLQEPPELELLENHCRNTPSERAAAARVLYASDHPDTESVGVDLLLRDLSGGFSVFGIDTLYRVAEADPSHLFEQAAANYTNWDPALQQQVLLVTRHVRTVVGPADLSWVVELLSNPEERTRIEAARALGGYGWRQSLRNQVDIDAVFSDPSPKVRASAYRMLGEWGDRGAITTLGSAAALEQDERARVVAAEALIPHRDRHAFTVPETLTEAWPWAAEHAAYDKLATEITSREPGDA